MVNDLTTLNTYNLQHNFLILWISSMQQIRLCVVNKTFCFDKKTSNFHKKQTLTATLEEDVDIYCVADEKRWFENFVFLHFLLSAMLILPQV